MNILGVSCYFHDAAAALLRDGLLVAAAEEERFTRRKHDASFPRHAIEFCLQAGGISGRELDYVVFFEKPFLKIERLLVSALGTFPRSPRMFQEAMISWLGGKLWIKHLLQERLGLPPARILFSEHHLSHAASAFFCSPYEDAAILTIDGAGEWTTASVGVGRGNTIRLLEEIRFPHSLGLLYSACTAFLGFEVNEGEYKVMGMAAYGTPRHLDKVYRVLRLAPDGSFELDMDYFAYHHSTRRMISPQFEALFGTPREPGAPFNPDDPDSRHYADIAASVQAATEQAVLGMTRRAHERTGLRRLCMAGGVALNSVANARVLRECPFDEIYIQPSAGDGGGALGAALYGYHMALGEPRGFVMEHASWGKESSDAEIRALLEGNGIAYSRFTDESKLADAVARALAQGKIVGWVQGRFEWGPRALGHRSILADPRPPEMKDVINEKVKYREPFRPFAPSVLAGDAERYFDLPDAARHYPARFMLYVAPVREEQRAAIPAVTHVDGSARLQVVHRDYAPRYARVIEAFGEATGVPVLLNTSFNLKGEPIVNTPQQAFETWQRSGMDVLVLGDFLVEKPAPRS